MSNHTEFSLHHPSLYHLVLNALRLRQIQPHDICHNPDLLFQRYSRLAGDPDLGHGNDGNCQSWRGDWSWWEKFLRDRGVK